jgi:hypothetical protein
MTYFASDNDKRSWAANDGVTIEARGAEVHRAPARDQRETGAATGA